MTDARAAAELPPTYADLERRFNGPIPQHLLDALKHGSATNAEIVRVEDSIFFYRGEIVRKRRSAKKWRALGNLEMVRRNMTDSRLYLREWRKLRRHLKDLRATAASLKGAKRVLSLISQVMDKEPGDD